MPREPIVLLSVSWRYDVTVELRISKRNWSKISRGEQVTIRGNSYYYEGEFFGDYWDFFGWYRWRTSGEIRIAEGPLLRRSRLRRHLPPWIGRAAQARSMALLYR